MAQLGLDRPLPQQYLSYLNGLVHGNLGTSLVSDAPVSAIIAARLPTTLLLIAFACVIAAIVGLPAALLGALRRDRAVDHVVRFAAVFSFSAPSYWVAVLLSTFVGVTLGWFPAVGYGTGFLDNIDHLFLPALTLALTFLAVLIRALRSSIIDVLRTDYVALARLKGLSEPTILRRHVLRNGLIPATIVIGLNVSGMLGTTVIVESVFGIPGIGSTLVNSILQHDFPVVQGIALVFAIIVIAVNLAVDLISSALDPRMATSQ